MNALQSTLRFAATGLLIISCGPNNSTSSISSMLGLADNGITVYMADKPVTSVEGNLQINPNELRSEPEQQRVLEYMQELMTAAGLSLDADTRLKLTRITNDRKGASLRFAQFHRDMPVDGGEAVAIFDQNGVLHALNLLLKTDIAVNSDAPVPDNEALEWAKEKIHKRLRLLGLKKLPLAIQSSKLLVANTKQFGWQQIWRFGVSPLTFDIIASGPHAGQLVKLRQITTDFSGNVSIYNGAYVPLIATEKNKGILVLKNGKETDAARLAKIVGKNLVTPGVLAAQENIQLTSRFYHEVFGRDSFDGKGATITAVADLGTGFFNLQGGNASWNPIHQIFSFGVGNDIFDDLAKAPDVVGHEFTHAVISHTSDLKYFSETGALNEHFADVFGEFVQHFGDPDFTPYLIGETVAREDKKPLRNMLDPKEGFAQQPSKMSEIEDEFKNHCEGAENPKDNCGVHVLSGIPNAAASKIITAIGWEKARWLYYRVMTARLLANSRFADYRRQMLGECRLQLEDGDCQAVAAALDDVEIIDDANDTPVL